MDDELFNGLLPPEENKRHDLVHGKTRKNGIKAGSNPESTNHVRGPRKNAFRNDAGRKGRAA
jgi:hypothetical protein